MAQDIPSFSILFPPLQISELPWLGGYQAATLPSVTQGSPLCHAVTDTGQGNKSVDEIRYYNGTNILHTAGSNPTIVSDFGAKTRIGNWANDINQILVGHACEIIVYDTALNAQDFALVEGYLKTKWGY